MEVESFNTRVLIAKEGMYLTQVDDNIAIQDRIIADRIALGVGDSAINYKEITEQEADEIRSAKYEYERQRLESNNQNNNLHGKI